MRSITSSVSSTVVTSGSLPRTCLYRGSHLSEAALTSSRVSGFLRFIGLLGMNLVTCPTSQGRNLDQPRLGRG